MNLEIEVKYQVHRDFYEAIKQRIQQLLSPLTDLYIELFQ